MKKFLKIFLFIILSIPILTLYAKVNLNIKKLDLIKYDSESKIIIYFSVEDTFGVPIKNLSKDNFNLKLISFNKEFNIKDFDIETVLPNDEPIYIVLLFDASESMLKNNAFDESKKAAKSFIENLRDIDKVMIISFSDSVEIIENFNNDRNKLKEAINNIKTGEYTKLYDALTFTLEKLNEIPSNRKLVVLLSDGKDSKEESYKLGSNSTIEDVLRKCEIYKIPIYSIGLGNADLNLLDKLSTLTKGVNLYTTDQTQLKNLYNKILESLKDTYKIELKDPNPARKMDIRKIFIGINVNGDTVNSEKSFIVKGNINQNKNNLPLMPILYILIVAILIVFGLIIYKKRMESSVYYKSKEMIKKEEEKIEEKNKNV
ncbi:MAG: vWA domain-containing protein [Minisyncoccia bacterium]